MTIPAYRFDHDYREEARLSDGTRVVLRVVRPEDRELLRRGFDRLSSESRYLRFLGVKPRLSEAEVASLLDLDGEQRFAIGAVGAGPAGGAAAGLGIARFARLPDEPDVAEAAVVVVDAMQARGLGSLLLRRLAAAARERGIRAFRGEMLLRNEAMRRVIESHAEAAVVAAEGDTLRVLVELPAFDGATGPASEGSGLLDRLLAQAAAGGLVMRIGDALLKRR